MALPKLWRFAYLMKKFSQQIHLGRSIDTLHICFHLWEVEQQYTHKVNLGYFHNLAGWHLVWMAGCFSERIRILLHLLYNFDRVGTRTMHFKCFQFQTETSFRSIISSQSCIIGHLEVGVGWFNLAKLPRTLHSRFFNLGFNSAAEKKSLLLPPCLRWQKLAPFCQRINALKISVKFATF